jgi:adenosylhomocysteine nucleosidase
MDLLPRKIAVLALPAESDGVFEDAGVAVIFCGVGKVNAAMVLAGTLARYGLGHEAMPLVINFGTAGSRVHGAGTLVSCHEFVQRDMDVRGLGFALGVTPLDESPALLSFDSVFNQLPAARCGTGDSFATQAIDMQCDVVDMEAYALAKVCRHHEARFACVKYVTDGADHAAADDWQQNVHKAAEDFLRLFNSISI